MGIKSNLHITFNGDCGSSVEDADLLAELREISIKTSTNRFGGEDSAMVSHILVDENAAKSNSSLTEKPLTRSNTAENKHRLTPWKQKNVAKSATTDAEVDVVAVGSEGG